MVIVFNAIWGHRELSLQECQELYCQHNITRDGKGGMQVFKLCSLQRLCPPVLWESRDTGMLFPALQQHIYTYS